MPQVSVILPTYNHAHFLPFSLRSVLGQSLQDFEVLVVDDGSRDNTSDVVKQFPDPRIHYIYQANRGLAAARNTGIRAASGDYLAFLDADDVFSPCKLEAQVHWLQQHPECGFVAGAWSYIDEDGQYIGEYRPGNRAPELHVQNWLYGCRVNPISVLVARAWVNQVGGFDEHLRQVEDYDLWLRLAYAGCQMGWVDAIVGSYRFSRGQMTRNAAVQKQSTVQMMDKFYATPGLSPEMLAIKAQVYSHLYLVSASREYGVGQTADAQGSLCKAIEYDPALAGNWNDAQIDDILSWENGFNFDGVAIDFRKHLFDHLPPRADALRKKQRAVMGEGGLKSMYTAFHARDWQLVQRAALVVMQNIPARMLNRGVLSILWQSVKHTTLSHTAG
jgi:glycosyltransferase involved in cell wall biosynthesis